VVGWAADVSADVAMNRAVDHGPRVDNRSPKGLHPDLIWTTRGETNGCGCAAQLWSSEQNRGQRRLTGDLAGDGVLELGATVWDADGLYAELGGQRTQPGLQGGGSGDV
jgi:hypothetical protein